MITKAQLKSKIRPDNSLKTRVWACLILHTVGYKGELAQIMAKTAFGPRPRPLKPNDISRELHFETVKYFQGAGIKDEEVLKKMKVSKENLRRALQELEEAGLCERRFEAKPLKLLSKDQLKRLTYTDKLEIYCWLTPKPAETKKILEDWKYLEANQVVKNCLPSNPMYTPSIRQILNTLTTDRSKIAKITSHDGYATIITEAWNKAKQQFDEVVNGWLLQVENHSGPEEGTIGGTFESSVERNTETHAAAAPEARKPQNAAAADHGLLTQELTARGLGVHNRKMLAQIVANLNDTPLPFFLDLLDNRRDRGKIGTGLLPELANDARLEYQTIFPGQEVA